MQSIRNWGAIAALAVFVAGPAFAEAQAPRARTAAVDAVAREADPQAGLLQECKAYARQHGPVASYRRGAVELTAWQVKACNRFPIQLQMAGR